MISKYLLILLILSFSFCAGTAKNIRATKYEGLKNIPENSKDTSKKDNVEIKYLGTSGFLIKRGNISLLTAPFFSNPNFLRLGLWKIHPVPERIDKGMKDVDVSNVKVILIGHAHYDHAMDIPYIHQKYTPNADILSNNSAKNLLLSKDINPPIPENKIHVMDKVSANLWTEGIWFCYSNSGKTDCDSKEVKFRIMGIRSEHAPHFFGVKLYQGEVEEVPDSLPVRAESWKEGQTLSYIIDFMGEKGNIDFRIHFQDSSSNSPFGFPPAFRDKDKKNIDVALMCIPGWKENNNFPQEFVLNTKPSYIILSHWENFFKEIPDDLKELTYVPNNDPDDFIEKLDKVVENKNKYFLPYPGASFKFDINK
ncbi:MAG: MBL fold metallo-hydrolase [Leptospiraceae bacterium]|nr:MBL fold metallo-hydrolase [Leptospiraceae bacterium]